MRWFEGSIPAAIASAKQQNAVFLVVITGEDEQSSQMTASWEDDRVAEATRSSFVAIKLDAKSETCVQFSQIYPVVCIPSSFFIGENGIPLEVIAGSVPVEELIKRISKVRQMHAQQTGTPDRAVAVAAAAGIPAATAPLQPPVSQDPVVQQVPILSESQASASAEDSSAASPASKELLSRPVEDGGPSGHATPSDDRSLSSDDVSLSSQSDESLSAKVERLTKKLEERREQKRRGEEENQIRKEVERRKIGKEMLDYKKKQEGERTKRMLEERNREKAEERAARERVRQQIALDRAERAARYAKSTEEAEAAKVSALQAVKAEQEARREVLQKERSAVARIQFRLPDGSSFTNQFPLETRLREAREFAAQEVGNRYGNFSLATMFPRREFTREDLDRTLLELELVPSASVVLLPVGRPANTVVPSSAGGFWSVLGTIFYPLLAVWRFISSFLFPTPPRPGSTSSVPPPRPGPSTVSSGEAKREPIRKRVLEKRADDFKKDGKIYRLRTQEDSEDDNNTWNGNSTQQM
ncbi:UBX domain-containing protein 4-like isoform X11 [Brienomyrus brachyistius]|uniref:UBX domain-containing protein 4-like isoform X8 n=1 Tax=Brienomyrus brachyistius TaxID=42636 RepID=UPI0020B2C875|nr:UBX domain-containing protein 4-like isoform X8 [Brienomyrus brachyistius]XP_048833919.1 UBX domain-containing protein 4-like isoform X9 [Brienomyrus brachyistius]XP_048833921.1 UBX domain-containing protein 4-like isoform X11 [Brienomyrus brachyistius]